MFGGRRPNPSAATHFMGDEGAAEPSTGPAFADARSEEAARVAGLFAFLAKPARPDALLRLIGRLLDGRETVRPAHSERL